MFFALVCLQHPQPRYRLERWMTLRPVNYQGARSGSADAHGRPRFKGSNICALLGRARRGSLVNETRSPNVALSSSRGVNDGLGCTSRGRLHVWRCTPLWTPCWRAARARGERAGPTLWLELALVVRQHNASRAVRRVAWLSVFCLSLGRSHSCAYEKPQLRI
jgi:hypothetical protein